MICSFYFRQGKINTLGQYKKVPVTTTRTFVYVYTLFTFQQLHLFVDNSR